MVSQTVEMNDNVILKLYELWSEEFYCAGFMDPSREAVERFRHWLGILFGPVVGHNLEDYEQEVLSEYHRQNEEASPS